MCLRKTSVVWVVLSLQLSCGPSQPGANAPNLYQIPISADFSIVARYDPGFYFNQRLNATLTADGKVVEKDEFNHEPRESRISEDGVRSLIAKIRETDFFSLKPEYGQLVLDGTSRILKITLDGTTHEVVVRDFKLATENEAELRRFYRLFSAVNNTMPSPCPFATPDRYSR